MQFGAEVVAAAKDALARVSSGDTPSWQRG
jgi:hypothetical protein